MGGSLICPLFFVFQGSMVRIETWRTRSEEDAARDACTESCTGAVIASGCAVSSG
jgi:hypothetical protein